MKIPFIGKPAIVAAVACGLALSGCVTDGYGRSYGSLSIGSGWYDDYYDGYYPGYYDYGYWGYPGYYYSPHVKRHDRWKGRNPQHRDWRGQSFGQGRNQWQGRDRPSRPNMPQSQPVPPRGGDGWKGERTQSGRHGNMMRQFNSSGN